MESLEKLKKIKKDGTEKEYDVLSTFEYKKREFVLYTDYSNDENNNIRVFSGILENNGTISAISQDEDENIVSNFTKFLEKGIKDNSFFEEN